MFLSIRLKIEFLIRLSSNNNIPTMSQKKFSNSFNAVKILISDLDENELDLLAKEIDHKLMTYDYKHVISPEKTTSGVKLSLSQKMDMSLDEIIKLMGTEEQEEPPEGDSLKFHSTTRLYLDAELDDYRSSDVSFLDEEIEEYRKLDPRRK